MNRENYFEQLLRIKNENDFEKIALEVFRYQSENNSVYREFIKNLGTDPASIDSINRIPFLPIEIFKSQAVLTGDEKFEKIFTSSGTTGENVSRHFVKEISLYEKTFTQAFIQFYGHPSDYVLLALLPSYLEREGSSLIYMMEKLIAQSASPLSGFYLDDLEKLYVTLNQLNQRKQKTILFGVTFALLDFAASFRIDFPELVVMETGGMKGRRKEMVRDEVHEILCSGFGVKQIHSEYGMTELLSQAYSKGNGIFETPPWMQIQIRDASDPLINAGINITGGINIIDLANINSCSFIATQDLGKKLPDNSFEVLGRFDFSDIRGCNLFIN